MVPIEFDEFFSWLAAHGDEDIIGWPGQCFHSPLARFLSARAGRAFGVDGTRYGWALADACQWRELPRWAQLFTAYSEAWFGRVMTALQAVSLLVQVETVLSPAVLVAA